MRFPAPTSFPRKPLPADEADPSPPLLLWPPDGLAEGSGQDVVRHLVVLRGRRPRGDAEVLVPRPRGLDDGLGHRGMNRHREFHGLLGEHERPPRQSPGLVDELRYRRRKDLKDC